MPNGTLWKGTPRKAKKGQHYCLKCGAILELTKTINDYRKGDPGFNEAKSDLDSFTEFAFIGKGRIRVHEMQFFFAKCNEYHKTYDILEIERHKEFISKHKDKDNAEQLYLNMRKRKNLIVRTIFLCLAVVITFIASYFGEKNPIKSLCLSVFIMIILMVVVISNNRKK